DGDGPARRAATGVGGPVPVLAGRDPSVPQVDALEGTGVTALVLLGGDGAHEAEPLLLAGEDHVGPGEAAAAGLTAGVAPHEQGGLGPGAPDDTAVEHGVQALLGMDRAPPLRPYRRLAGGEADRLRYLTEVARDRGVGAVHVPQILGSAAQRRVAGQSRGGGRTGCLRVRWRGGGGNPGI